MSEPFKISMSKFKQADCWIELVHGYEGDPNCSVTHVHVINMRYELEDGSIVTALKLERMLLDHSLLELRVHDGVHEAGLPCIFAFRGFPTEGVFV